MVSPNCQLSSIDIWQEVPNGLLDGQELTPEDAPVLLGGREVLRPEADRFEVAVLVLFKYSANGSSGRVTTEA